MENQPSTGRPWFRMASLARMETAAPATAPPPPRPTQPPPSRVPMVRPLVALPQSPPPPPPQQQETRPMSMANGAATESQQPPRPQASPPPPPSPRQRVLPWTPTPPESPRVIRPSSQALPESPRTTQLRPIIAPPPPYPEPEPKLLRATQTKNIPMQEGDTNGNTKPIRNINGEPRAISRSQAPPLSPMREYTATDGTSATQKKDNDEREMKILTMAGKNMGAYMELASPNRHHQHLNMKQQNGLEYHQTTESESGGEDGKNKDKKKATKSAAKGKPMFAVANSNVQSVNNSILFSSSCSQHSPGVHTTLASHRQPKGTTTNSSSAKGNPHPK